MLIELFNYSSFIRKVKYKEIRQNKMYIVKKKYDLIY